MNAISSRRRRMKPGTVVLHAVLILASVTMVVPFIWMMINSFKSQAQLLTDPLSLVPKPWTVSNYVTAWTTVPFGHAYINSLYICALVVIGTLITASMAGYGFARIRFRGDRALFVLFLATQMIPAQVTLVPFYLLMSKFGWVDSHLSLIIPTMMVNPFAVFLMRQFVLSLPKELEEAALIDGCSRWTTFWLVILPNLRPGLAALAIISALGVWNSFLFPLVLLNTPDKFTVPLMLTSYQSQYGSMNYGLVMAASAISTVPMLIAFVIGQRKIIDSMANSGLGGR